MDGALARAHRRYRKIRVPKRSGGFRIMIEPSTELKMIQQWLLVNILHNLPDGPIASAFFKGASIVRNANVHRNSLYSVRIDIADFFSSIKFEDLKSVLLKESRKNSRFTVSAECLHVIRLACFGMDGRLPIGYLSSPKIANAVMFEIDATLDQVIAGNIEKYGHAVLTRYADDFVFSTDKKGACRIFLDEFRNTLNSISVPMLKVNGRKTRFMSRRGGSTLVTGLRINNHGEVRVHPEYRDHVRLLLKLLSEHRLDSCEQSRLRGHLAFIEHADPALFTRLSYRYHSLIAQLRFADTNA